MRGEGKYLDAGHSIATRKVCHAPRANPKPSQQAAPCASNIGDPHLCAPAPTPYLLYRYHWLLIVITIIYKTVSTSLLRR